MSEQKKKLFFLSMELQRSFLVSQSTRHLSQKKKFRATSLFASFMPHVVCTFSAQEPSEQQKKNISLLNSTFNFAIANIMNAVRYTKYYSTNFLVNKTKIRIYP